MRKAADTGPRRGGDLICRCSSTAGAALIAAVAYLVYLGSSPPSPVDFGVAKLDAVFNAALLRSDGISVSSKGHLLRDRDTFFWNLFTDKFGANPNTPYMWSALPLIGFLLPSPMWNLGEHDAVVLLARVPPAVEYFSFTTFALFMPRRGKPLLPFSSLGDSVNNLNIKHHDGLFAHVVTANARTFRLVEAALAEAGLPSSAINLRAVPSGLGLFDDVLELGGQVRLGTYYEVVLRLFRFQNQTAGDAYLRSAPPVYYLKATHEVYEPLEQARWPAYQDRSHPDAVLEGHLAVEFDAHTVETLARVGRATNRAGIEELPSLPFTPLLIKGLECLKQDTECLGDCPDAAYFGPNIKPHADDIAMLRLDSDGDIHVIVAVNHRQLNSSIYGSLALLKPHPLASPVLNKSRMSVRATSLGVTSFDFNTSSKYVSWGFARSASLCDRLRLAGALGGCSVVDPSHVPKGGYLTYCERVYLNPLTGLGPDWATLLPARLIHISLASHPLASPPIPPRGLPAALPLAVFAKGSQTMRFFHIIKTGGESLELYLAGQPSPKLNYSHCRAAGMRSGWRTNLTSAASPVCAIAAAAVSCVLCALNCECCAADVRVPNGFHGILIRSPRAHLLSLFSHCHTAHTRNTWRRMLNDVPQYLAEVMLRSTEWSCGTFCGISFEAEWEAALRAALQGDPAQERTLRVLPLHDTQSHSLTCSTASGSLGQHFRVFDGVGGGGGGVSSGDVLHPPVEQALAALDTFEWLGLTDLFDHSLCLLHYQANGSLPSACTCVNGAISLGLPRFNHGVIQRDPSGLPTELLARIDEYTQTDARVFAKALRLLLGRLRTVEERTGTSLLACIDWHKLYRTTHYVPGLWAGPDELLPAALSGDLRSEHPKGNVLSNRFERR